jgi:glycosyltransferase involved in cell wall biosynthesis
MSNRRPQVSVVIPAFKQTALLRSAVESLFTQDLAAEDYEAVVVDSSPDDANRLVVEELASRAPFYLRCLRKKPEGPGPSRNLGVAETTGTIVAFMDSDCVATPGWLRTGIAAFEYGIGIVQGRTMPDPSGPPPSNHTWYLQVEQETPYYETANVFYDRLAFEQSAGFPDDLHPTHDKHMGGEDVVVAWSVIRKGWKTRFCPEALVYHAVLPLPVYRAIVIKHHFVVPWLVGQFPELRRFMYRRYFLDRGQALVTLVVAGAVLGTLAHWSFCALVLPYAAVRLSEPPGSFRGILRPLRVAAFLARDLASFAILLGGTLRYRCVLL